MCKEYRWVISVASISGAFQSLLWLGFGIAGALTYLCLLPVAEYRYPEEFIPVTLVKLYFEGPKCTIDGSYLGRFEEDRRSISLFTSDRVFGVMIAYVVLNAVYFVLSVFFYISRSKPSKRVIALGWSTFTLVICALDALFTYALVLDAITLKDYLAQTSENSLPDKASDIPYIPIVLAVLASRFVAIWLWNFVIGLIIFMDALCCRNIIRKPQKAPKKEIQSPKPVGNVKQPPQQPQKPTDESPKPPVSLINSIHRSHVNVSSFDDYLDYRKSMEERTRFNLQEKPAERKEKEDWNWAHTQNNNYWHPKPHYSQDWDMTNEAFVSDEEEQEEKKHPDFDHDLRNFEPGQRKIKIVRRPQGKSVPVPPPMPPSGSCNC